MKIAKHQLKELNRLWQVLESLAKPWRAKVDFEIKIGVGLKEVDNSIDNPEGYAPTPVIQIKAPTAMVEFTLYQCEEEEAKYLIEMPHVPTFEIALNAWQDYSFYISGLKDLLESSAPTEQEWEEAIDKQNMKIEAALDASEQLEF